jgi:MscS family membrane protein
MDSKRPVFQPEAKFVLFISSIACMALAFILLLIFSFPPASQAGLAARAAKAMQNDKKSEESADKKADIPTAKPPLDHLGRGTPRGAIEGFNKHVQERDGDRAVKYLDLSEMPWLKPEKAHELAGQLYVSLRRGLLIDLDSISNQPGGSEKDNLPPNQERVGFIVLPDHTVDIKLHRVDTKEGRKVWLFTPKVVREIPGMISYYELNPFSRFLSEIIPAYEILGVPLFQWVGVFLILSLAYLLARILIRIFISIWSSRRGPLKDRTQRLLHGPIALLVTLLVGKVPVDYLDLTVEGQVLRSANTLLTITLAWLGVSLLGLLFHWIERRADKRGHGDLAVILRPVATVCKVLLITVLALVWLDNLGFSVTTILASLGIGGIAVALAAQDTLKNVFGSLAVLADKPYIVGERIVVKGHDGFVEEIGLRSTRMRLLDGNQVIVPNETMAQIDILNIGRRPHIRQISNIGIHVDTPAEKAREAVEIVREIMDNHEGMDPEFPPRIYLNKFEVGWLNIFMVYWYHPPDFWAFNEFNNKANLQIMEAFERRGIRLAMPARTHYVAPYEAEPVDIAPKES